MTPTLVVLAEDRELLWLLLTQQCACRKSETMEMIGHDVITVGFGE